MGTHLAVSYVGALVTLLLRNWSTRALRIEWRIRVLCLKWVVIRGLLSRLGWMIPIVVTLLLYMVWQIIFTLLELTCVLMLYPLSPCGLIVASRVVGELPSTVIFRAEGIALAHACT